MNNNWGEHSSGYLLMVRLSPVSEPRFHLPNLVEPYIRVDRKADFCGRFFDPKNVRAGIEPLTILLVATALRS